MCRLLGLVLVYVLALFSNEVSAMKVVSIENCPYTKVDKIDGLIYEIKANPGGTFTGRLKAPFDIDDSILFSATFSTWIDGNWRNEAMTLSGDLCEALNNYIPTLWGKVADAVNVPHNCPIPAGDYHLEDFPVIRDDLNFPIDLDNKILIHSELTKDGKLFLCQEIEISP